MDLAPLGYAPLKLEANRRRSRWLVPAAINGKPCKLLLDTGADFVILDSWAPAYLDVATRPSGIKAMTVGGARDLVVGESSFSLAAATVSQQHLRAFAQGDRPPAATTTSPLCGNLGLNALRGLGVALDIRRHTLWIPGDPTTRVASAMARIGASAIPIKRTSRSGHMFIEGKAGTRDIRMVIDSGAERSVLSSSTAEAMKLALKESNAMIADAETANRHPKLGVLKDVVFGQAQLPQLPVMVIPLTAVFDALSDGEAAPIDGIIGADVLEQGGGIIDVAANALYLTGNATAPGG